MTATFSRASTRTAQEISPKIFVHPKRVIAIGDSLIYGYGDSEGGGWVERLRRGWMDPETSGPILYNLGIRGDGVVQVAKRLEREFFDRGELRHRTPDVLVLSFGVNDSARAGHAKGRPVTDLETFELTFSRLLQRACALCPVYFVGMVPIDETAMPFANILHFSRFEQRRYRDVMCRLCELHQVPFLDLLAQWEQQSDEWICDRLCIDGIHPNVLGYRTILEAVGDWQPLMSAIQ